MDSYRNREKTGTYLQDVYLTFRDYFLSYVKYILYLDSLQKIAFIQD